MWRRLLLLRVAPAALVRSTLVSFVLAQLSFGVWLLLGRSLSLSLSLSLPPRARVCLCYICLLLGRNGFGILLILVAGFSSLLCVILRRWLPFAVAMLSLATDILTRNPLLCDVGVRDPCTVLSARSRPANFLAGNSESLLGFPTISRRVHF